MASDVTLALMVNDVAATSASLGDLWCGGRGIFLVSSATFGGGSVKLQMLAPAPAATWVDVPDVSLTAAGMVGFELPPARLRATATTATAVYAYAMGTRVD